MSIQSFVWGEERPVFAQDLWAYFECAYNGQYYELPFSINAHAKYYYSLLYIRSALQAKANIISSCYQPHPLLSRQAFARLIIDFLWFGNAYLERVTNRQGQLLQLKPAPAKYTRRMTHDDYGFLHPTTAHQLHKFTHGSIYHLLAPDVNQEIYGVPEWLPAIQSALLNNAATQFRLRYYHNGSHAGYIMYLTDANINENDVDLLQEQLKQSKGPGNFRNLLLYAPNGKADGIKLLPISEVTAKDEFFNIKSISRDDQLAACRVPPNLIGIVPTNTSGFGNIKDAAMVFAQNEVEPIAHLFLSINDWLGEEIMQFKPYAQHHPSATRSTPRHARDL